MPKMVGFKTLVSPPPNRSILSAVFRNILYPSGKGRYFMYIVLVRLRAVRDPVPGKCPQLPRG
jgi:hypothetical protein